MKLLIKSACVAFVLSVLFSMLPFEADCREISDEVFRLHILANSDSEEDQALKLRVRDRVLKRGDELFNSAKTKEEAEKLTASHLQELADIAADEIADSGYDYPVRAELTRMYFNTRRYASYTLPAGTYDALRLVIGKGEGHNWWCGMYPSLCVGVASEQDEKARGALTESQYELVTDENTEYRFKLVEIFEKICSLF